MEKLINALKIAFASEFVFYYKSHQFHWNIESNDFYEYHELLNTIWNEVYESIDSFSENIRKSYGYSPRSLSEILSLSIIKESPEPLGQMEMVSTLLEDSDRMCTLLAEVYKIADAAGEYGLANFLADRQDAHRKHSWFLRASLK